MNSTIYFPTPPAPGELSSHATLRTGGPIGTVAVAGVLARRRKDLSARAAKPPKPNPKDALETEPWQSVR